MTKITKKFGFDKLQIIQFVVNCNFSSLEH